MQDSQTRLKKLSGDLACLSRIVAFIATLKCSLSEAERGLLESYLCPDLQGGGGTGGGGITDQGWEETMDASLTFLLKTALAKNAKDSATLPNSALEVRDLNLDLLVTLSFILPPASIRERLALKVINLSRIEWSTLHLSQQSILMQGLDPLSCPLKFYLSLPFASCVFINIICF